MEKKTHTASRLLAGAGGLMTMSGLLMVLCGRVAIGGIFWAAAACMFFAARSFRIAEEKEKSEESNQNETTV